jgi:hypothetical protein
MTDQDKLSDEIKGKAFVQIMENIRKQDDLIHSWTKYYLSIQAGLAIALAFILGFTAEKNGFLMKVGSLFLPLLGIVTTVLLTRIIVREHKWQGRYICSLNKIKNLPVIYENAFDPEKPGYIAKQFLWIRWFLIAGWIVIAVIFGLIYLCQGILFIFECFYQHI